MSKSSSVDIPEYQDQLRAHWREILQRLTLVRRHRPDALPQPPTTGTTRERYSPTRLATMASAHLENATGFWIGPDDCATAFADSKDRPLRGMAPQQDPSRQGLAVLATEYRLPLTSVEIAGVQWGRINGGWWVVPLTYAGELELRPRLSLAPVCLGYLLPDNDDDSTHGDPEQTELSALLLSLWRRLPAPPAPTVPSTPKEAVPVARPGATR